VIAGMEQAYADDSARVAGFKANGGFLAGLGLTIGKRKLAALPTRDAVLPALSVMALARSRNVKISALLQALPKRHTASDRIQNFPSPNSAALLDSLQTDDNAYRSLWGEEIGELAHQDLTDGLRLTFANSEIVHLRPSGNAPELRCYAEAATAERADALVNFTLKRVAGLFQP
jgi:phosphomannomutase